MKEIWKTVGINKNYQVSNLGRARSVSRMIKHKAGGLKKWSGRILIPSKVSAGYTRISLGSNKSNLSMHRAVAELFIPNPENKPWVNHINGIKSDNRVKNLEWCTPKENEQHSWKVLGKKASKHKRASGLQHADSIPVAIIENDQIVKVFQSSVEASKEIHRSVQNIRKVCRGKRKHCGGFSFIEITRDKYYEITRTMKVI